MSEQMPEAAHIGDPAMETGAVVFLRSGGPPMTVRSVAGDTAVCEWFGPGDAVQSHAFLAAMVTTRFVSRDGKMATSPAAATVVTLGNLGTYAPEAFGKMAPLGN